MIIDNYVNEKIGFENCLNWQSISDLDQMNDQTKNLPPDDVGRLNDLIPSHNLSYCAPLKDRFETWEAGIERRCYYLDFYSTMSTTFYNLIINTGNV